jgi:NAD(P)-dependent dehydrogenase (short-subunit alcohol dehydrogenase family)
MALQDKVALITGGAKGIGLATAEIFLREGARVIILDTDTDAGGKAKQRLGDRMAFYPADVSRTAEVQSAIEAGVSHFGRLDFLVNNAGIIRYANAVTCTDAQWDLIMNINVKAAFLCAKFAIPHMQKQSDGVIINVASAQSFISSSNMMDYTTSKSALLGFTRSLAIDFGPAIRAVAICPGTVDTPLARDAWNNAKDPEAVHQESIDMHILKRIGRPEEIGEMIVFLCGDKCTFMTGQAIRLDGGLGISVPGSVED